MSLVVDASITTAWYFEDEATAAAEEVLDQVVESNAIVPSIRRFEVGNALQMAIRRKRITEIFCDDALARLLAMPITVDPGTDAHAWTTALRLSERFGLTLCDAPYLELAERRSLSLATLDRGLRKATSALGVVLLGSA
ncbi:MAG: type II toxin-antitoxin system VapC family toxin [Acetobacteraceae bacterium]